MNFKENLQTLSNSEFFTGLEMVLEFFNGIATDIHDESWTYDKFEQRIPECLVQSKLLNIIATS